MKRKRQKKTPTKRTPPSRKEAEAIIRKETQHVSEKDLETVLSKSEDIRKKFERGGPLGKFGEDFKLLLALVQDYWKGKYRAVPFWTVGAIVFALLYVLNPLDLIPDVIPVIGHLDDAAVVAGRINMRSATSWVTSRPVAQSSSSFWGLCPQTPGIFRLRPEAWQKDKAMP